mmetsp:Transcript_16380/g.47042  ORF Transcript_16380/g.47042 Transcript_16380/m.47042 type:complete len:280 (-) Transcript_16380:1683-2522(-)
MSWMSLVIGSTRLSSGFSSPKSSSSSSHSGSFLGCCFMVHSVRAFLAGGCCCCCCSAAPTADLVTAASILLSLAVHESCLCLFFLSSRSSATRLAKPSCPGLGNIVLWRRSSRATHLAKPSCPKTGTSSDNSGMGNRPSTSSALSSSSQPTALIDLVGTGDGLYSSARHASYWTVYLSFSSALRTSYRALVSLSARFHRAATSLTRSVKPILPCDLRWARVLLSRWKGLSLRTDRTAARCSATVRVGRRLTGTALPRSSSLEVAGFCASCMCMRITARS